MKAEDQFDRFGNEPEAWFSSAIDLLTASAELGRASKEAAQRLEVPFSRSFWPRLMIRAFASECLIKAHFLRAGKTLCKDGEYRGIVKNERHDLTKLAREAGIVPSKPEANLLDRLSAVAVGVGRYPISKKVSAPKSVEWRSPRDEILFRSLINRLVEPLDKESLYADFLKEA
jgi:hypothetical protein